MVETWQILCITGSVGFLVLWWCMKGFKKKERRNLERHNVAVVVVQRPVAAPSSGVPPALAEDLPPPYEAAVKLPPPVFSTVGLPYSHVPPTNLPHRPLGTS